MDMKKILQAIDGTSTKPVESSNDMKRFLKIVKEGPQIDDSSLPSINATDLINDIKKEVPVSGVDDAAKLIAVKPDGNVDFKNTMKNMSGEFIKMYPDIIEMMETFMKNAAEAINTPEFKTLPPKDQQSIIELTKMGPQIQQMKASLVSLTKQHDSTWSANTKQVPERVTLGQAPQQGINRLTGKPIEPHTSRVQPSSSSNPSMPGSDFPKAEKADRQAGTVTLDGQVYKMVMLEPGGLRPRGGERISIPQAVMGERGIGNYIGILVGSTVYVLPLGEKESIQRESLFSKYLESVEQELLESKQQKSAKVKKLADKVIKEVGGNHGHFSKLRTHISRTQVPPDDITNMAKQGARQKMKREETEGVDSVTLDVPLMIRMLEFAREDAGNDAILHKVVERMIGMKEEGQSLSMSDYENIIGKVDEACWKNYKQIGMKKKGGKTVPNCVPKK